MKILKVDLITYQLNPETTQKGYENEDMTWKMVEYTLSFLFWLNLFLFAYQRIPFLLSIPLPFFFL